MYEKTYVINFASTGAQQITDTTLSSVTVINFDAVFVRNKDSARNTFPMPYSASGSGWTEAYTAYILGDSNILYIAATNLGNMFIIIRYIKKLL